MKSHKIIYSIIIPHKNTPHLLERCLKSIPERDDTQVIVVDDNSDADIVDFTTFPGLNMTNTEVYFKKEGKGAGYARNIGITKAKGKWLIFADADDFFNKSINEIMDKYINSNVDIVFFQTDTVNSETGARIKSRGNYYNSWLRKSIEQNSILDEVRFKINPPWGKFFGKEFVNNNNIRFDEVVTANDVMFSTKCGFIANKIEVDLSTIYCSTIRTGSLDLTHSESNICSRFNVALNHFKYLKSVNKKEYHINIFGPINMFRKLDNHSSFRKSLKIAFQEMGLINMLNDLFEFLLLKINKHMKSQQNNKSNLKEVDNE